MKSSSLQDFKTFDPMKLMVSPSKVQKSVTLSSKFSAPPNRSSKTVAQPPSSTVNTALQPPVIQPHSKLSPSEGLTSTNPSPNRLAPPPSFSSLVDYPALPPPASKPTQPASSYPVLVIGDLRVSTAVPQSTEGLCSAPATDVQQTTSATPKGDLGVSKTHRTKCSAPSTDLAIAANEQQCPAPSTTPAIAAYTSTDSSTILRTSKVVEAYRGNFTFKPRHNINGTPCLSLFEQDKDRLLSKILYIVIVKFSHNRPKYIDFRLFLDAKKFEKGFRVTEFDRKHVFVEFESFNDFVKLWILKSIVIKGFKARLFRWDGDFNPSCESFMAPVWIHLPGLPLYLFDEEIVLSIGALFGKTIYIDPACLTKHKIGVLSFCVAMDVREEVVTEFWIEFLGEGIYVNRFKQLVVYGDKPPFCPSCNHLGHHPNSCMQTVELREHIKGKKPMVEDLGNNSDIPTVSVFKRLGVLGASTREQEIGCSSTAPGTILEKRQVQGVKVNAKSASAQKVSATVVVEEPSLESHNSLGGDNGAKKSGVLETRVNNLQISRRFEPLAVLDEEKTSVENGGLQQKTVDCFEEATLVDDNSLTRQDEGGNSASLDSQVNILQNPKEMRAKLSASRPESGLENRVLQFSAADSDEEATLLEDFSQLKQSGGEFPSVSHRKAGNLQVAGKIKVKSLLVCPENRIEDGTSLQTAAVFCDKPSLEGHISQSSDNQGKIFGALETSTKGLQNDASLDIPGATSDELSSDENGVSADAVQFSNAHNLGSGGATDLILGPTESQEDYLQSQGEKQVSNMLVNQVYPSKVVITHPVTKEVIVLSPTSQSVSAPVSTSSVGGMSKSERKKSKKKRRKEAEKKGKRVVEPIVLAEPIASPQVACKVLSEDWETLDSNASKDTPFWENYHAAQKDASLFAGLEAHPYMFRLDSEDELSTGASVTKHSRLHPTYKEKKARDRSLDYLDLHPISAKGLYQEKTVLPPESPKAAEEFVTPARPTSTSWASEVEEQDAVEDKDIYTLEEMKSKIIRKIFEELPFADQGVADILQALVPKFILMYAAGSPKNDATIAKLVSKLVFNFTGGSPDKSPLPEVASFLDSAAKSRKQAFHPP